MIIEVARRLITAWHNNWYPMSEVRKGLLDAGEIPGRDLVKAELNGVIPNTRTRAYLASYFSVASDMLWAGVDDEKVAQFMASTKPDKHMRHPVKPKIEVDCLFVVKRDLDKRHDWHTVK